MPSYADYLRWCQERNYPAKDIWPSWWNESSITSREQNEKDQSHFLESLIIRLENGGDGWGPNSDVFCSLRDFCETNFEDAEAVRVLGEEYFA